MLLINMAPSLFVRRALPILISILMPGWIFSQVSDSLLSIQKLKNLSLDELMNIEVISVSRQSEKLAEVASAIQVITNEDIQRSGATRLPEALQLVPNLQVAQAGSASWAITARGFNGAPISSLTLANKLLVNVDGRSIYNPLFGGVQWGVQNVLLEDINRIEVVSGPGGTLWGANAVNGIINIISKSSKETQGLYVSGAAGSFLQDFGGLRYGGHVDSNIFYRVYLQRYDQNSTDLANGLSNKDAWNMTQGGFRSDYYQSKRNTLTLEGDFSEGYYGTADPTKINSQDILARFAQVYSEKSNLSIQVYFDHDYRNSPSQLFNQDLKTFDLDFQHSFSLGNKQSIVWGGGYRLMNDYEGNSAYLSFIPASREIPIYSAFVQDGIELLPKLLKLTVGTKLLDDFYTGFDLQPSARLAWTKDEHQTIWAAVSQAVRTPSRWDEDALIPGIVVPTQSAKLEKVIAYELGYRLTPTPKLLVSFATFYNHYDNLFSLDYNLNTNPKTYFANDLLAETWGFEFSGNYQVMEKWRLRGGYTYLSENFWYANANVVPGTELLESNDPKNQITLQSILDLPRNFQFDVVGRYVDVLETKAVTILAPAYATFDVRLAHQFKQVEVALVGKNLAQSTHTEFGAAEIPRSIFAKITCRF